MKPKLLVSVRNLAEAEVALDGGADIIDVKEPNNGSLGRAAMSTINAIVDRLSGRTEISAALGELDELTQQMPLGPQLSFAKIGLSNCGNDAHWPNRLEEAWRLVTPTVARVAVAYADWQHANAPQPSDVISVGKQLQCSHFLLDTYRKTNALLDLVPPESLDRWFDHARNIGLQLVVAGSLREEDFTRIVQRWSPDVLAVRGAACAAGRNSEVSQRHVRRLRCAIDRAHDSQSSIQQSS